MLIILQDRPTSLSGKINPGYNFDADTKLESIAMIFYSERLGGNLLISSSSISGLLFGAVHCLAWNFTFPSHVEHVMWRSASLGVIGSCAAALYNVLSTLADNYFNCKGFWSAFMLFPLVFANVFLLFAAVLVYPVARLTLLILAITTLRSLPPSAFHTVDWIELVPHI